jgi:hypothetical protein
MAGVSFSAMHRRLRRMTPEEAVAAKAPFRPADLTGQRFNRLLVLGPAPPKKGKRSWRCRCDCENEPIVPSHELIHGLVKSCGCLDREVRASRRKATRGLVNDHGVKLIRPEGEMWLCACVCGTEFFARANHVMSNRRSGCGCVRLSKVRRQHTERAKRHKLFGHALSVPELAVLCNRGVGALRERLRRMPVEKACFGPMQPSALRGVRRPARQLPRCGKCHELGHNVRSCASELAEAA